MHHLRDFKGIYIQINNSNHLQTFHGSIEFYSSTMHKTKWVCLKMLCTFKSNGFADHYPYEKWLAIIGNINPTFSDKPKSNNFHPRVRALSLRRPWGVRDPRTSHAHILTAKHCQSGSFLVQNHPTLSKNPQKIPPIPTESPISFVRNIPFLAVKKYWFFRSATSKFLSLNLRDLRPEDDLRPLARHI